MRTHYDFSKAKRNPYAKRLKQQITIRLDKPTIEYFRELTEETGRLRLNRPQTIDAMEGQRIASAPNKRTDRARPPRDRLWTIRSPQNSE